MLARGPRRDAEWAWIAIELSWIPVPARQRLERPRESREPIPVAPLTLPAGSGPLRRRPAWKPLRAAPPPAVDLEPRFRGGRLRS